MHLIARMATALTRFHLKSVLDLEFLVERGVDPYTNNGAIRTFGHHDVRESAQVRAIQAPTHASHARRSRQDGQGVRCARLRT